MAEVINIKKFELKRKLDDKIQELNVLEESIKTANQNVTVTFENALNAAKSDPGMINCLLVTVSNDGTVRSTWANSHQPFTLLGILENVKAEFMDANIEKR